MGEQIGPFLGSVPISHAVNSLSGIPNSLAAAFCDSAGDSYVVVVEAVDVCEDEDAWLVK